MMRPQDLEGELVELGRWYWAFKNEMPVGTGQFACCNAASEDWTFFINGTAYDDPNLFRYLLATMPSRRG